MRKIDYLIGLEALESFIEQQSYAIPYCGMNKAPSTYKALCESYEKNKIFFVSNESSETSIYSSNQINTAFRAVHDSMHYLHGLTFKFKDEKKLSDITALIVFKWCKAQGYPGNVAYSAFKIVQAEIKGQIEYYERYDKFVVNQADYVKTWLNVAA